MRLRPWLMLSLALSWSCGGAQTPSEGSSSALPECTSPQAQKMLTYCVSPQAATMARQTDEMRKNLEMTKGQVNPKVFPLPTSTSAQLGPDDAAVTVVVFSDLECPYCSQAHEELETLQKLYPKDVRLVFKHFPLSFHENAKPAARAALAAQAQGKFWEFTKLAFEQQEELSDELYLKIAKTIGLDEAKFKAALEDKSTDAQLIEDLSLAKALYVQATPTIFLNGVALPGAVPAEQLKPIIEQQKKIAEAFMGAGVPKDEIYWRMVRAQYQPLEKPEVPEPERQIVAYIPVSDSPVLGSDAAKTLVTITVFSDFECPYCEEAVGPLQAILKKHPDDVRMVFKHFPLPFHERADEAAGLALLAQQAGKFWQAHDLLFASQEDLSDAKLEVIAKELGLPTKELAAAIKTPAFEEMIRRDMALGIKAGVEGTPTFYINGKQFVGIMSEDELEPEIQAQLALAKQLQAKGNATGEQLYEALVTANFEAEEAKVKAEKEAQEQE